MSEFDDPRDVTERLIARQDVLLRGVVDAIRGPHPDPLARWSVHDAPELAAALVAERDHWKMLATMYKGALRAGVKP